MAMFCPRKKRNMSDRFGKLNFMFTLTAACACSHGGANSRQDRVREHGLQTPLKVDLTKIVERSTPGAEHRALEPLVGKWHVEKKVFIALGTPDKPATSSGMTTIREWVANGHFLRDTTKGTINGQPYERLGFLGYNPMDRRYEWNTADNVTTIMMTYYGAKGKGATRPIDLAGAFTDVGVTGEENVGQVVAMRTRITIVDADHHSFEIFFTPPNGKELLADQMEFVRAE